MNKRTYCINCGSDKHGPKECSQPITSYGVILVNFNIDADVHAHKVYSSHDKQIYKSQTIIKNNQKYLDQGTWDFVRPNEIGSRSSKVKK